MPSRPLQQLVALQVLASLMIMMMMMIVMMMVSCSAVDSGVLCKVMAWKSCGLRGSIFGTAQGRQSLVLVQPRAHSGTSFSADDDGDHYVCDYFDELFRCR